MSLDSNRDASESEMFMNALAVSTIGLVAVGGIAKGVKALEKSHATKSLIKDSVKAGKAAGESAEEIAQKTMKIKADIAGGKNPKDLRVEMFGKDNAHAENLKTAGGKNEGNTHTLDERIDLINKTTDLDKLNHLKEKIGAQADNKQSTESYSDLVDLHNAVNKRIESLNNPAPVEAATATVENTASTVENEVAMAAEDSGEYTATQQYKGKDWKKQKKNAKRKNKGR